MGLLEQRRSVVFAGEHHMITLFEPSLDTAIASISCWRCNYSDHGEGYALARWYDMAHSTWLLTVRNPV